MGGVFAVSTVLPGKIQRLAADLEAFGKFVPGDALDHSLQVLPPDGSTIGNMSAREALGRAVGRQISEEDYEAVKDKALGLGQAA